MEKEAQAALNRAKEIEKVQARLARQEMHARKVLERKKAMQEKHVSFETDSAIGSSLNGSRSGSGRTTQSIELSLWYFKQKIDLDYKRIG